MKTELDRDRETEMYTQKERTQVGQSQMKKHITTQIRYSKELEKGHKKQERKTEEAEQTDGLRQTGRLTK